RMLPDIIQQKYADAKGAFDRKELATARTGFKQVLDLLADPDIAQAAAAPPLSEMRTLAAGFRDLSAPPPAPPPVRPAPAPVPAGAASRSDGEISKDDSDRRPLGSLTTAASLRARFFIAPRRHPPIRIQSAATVLPRAPRHIRNRRLATR